MRELTTFNGERFQEKIFIQAYKKIPDGHLIHMHIRWILLLIDFCLFCIIKKKKSLTAGQAEVHYGVHQEVQYETYYVIEASSMEIIILALYAFPLVFHGIASKFTRRIQAEELEAYKKKAGSGEEHHHDHWSDQKYPNSNI